MKKQFVEKKRIPGMSSKKSRAERDVEANARLKKSTRTRVEGFGEMVGNEEEGID